MANASLSPLYRKSSAKGKRKIPRFFVVSCSPTFSSPSGDVRKSEAVQRDVVELVLAVNLGTIPFK
jgi:hypothetical protein